MAISLYQAIVPQFLQVLPRMVGLLDKAEAWCQDKGLPPSALIDMRLAPDMHPLSYQARYTALHSAGAIKAVFDGMASPPESPPPQTFAELRALVSGAIADLNGLDADQLNAQADKNVNFVYRGEVRMRFTGTTYLLSFAQPNFYFHCSILYAILRNQGLDIGKRDFIGAVQVKQPA